MTRLLHVADTHVGCRQYGRESRRRDFLDAFGQAIGHALDFEVDAVVHAGDLFHHPQPGLADVHGIVESLQHLADADIPFLLIVGNHEWRRDTQWATFLERIGLARHLGATPDPFEIGGWEIVGLDYAGRSEVSASHLDGDVLVAHQLLDTVHPGGELPLADCQRFRYALLGDWHEHEVWETNDSLVTYPGSTERCSSAERETRGVNLIDLDAGTLETAPLDTRPFYFVESAEEWADLRESASDVSESVLCLRPWAEMDDVHEIEQWASHQGVLHLHPLAGDEADVEAVELGEWDVETSEIEAMIERELHPELSETGLEIERIIRDEEVPDSQVDGRVSEMLGANHGN